MLELKGGVSPITLELLRGGGSMLELRGGGSSINVRTKGKVTHQ